MSDLTCTGCGQELPPNGPISVGEIEAAIKHAFRDGAFYEYQLGKEDLTLKLRGKELPVVLVTRSVPNQKIFDYEGPQGVEYDLNAVFSINGEFYLKTGTADSYGAQSWGGPLKLVKPTTKTVTVFE